MFERRGIVLEVNDTNCIKLTSLGEFVRVNWFPSDIDVG